MIIAGPCALESKRQLQQTIFVLRECGIRFVRASLWKPRTSHSWDGMGDAGVDMLLDMAFENNMIPATEVITPSHAYTIMQRVKNYPQNCQVLLWIGSRNQNHLIQKEIATIAKDGFPKIYLMYKNQPWPDENHWVGIHSHIESTGFSSTHLITCHRGFFDPKNPEQLRNVPDFSMAMAVKKKTNIPMLFDPSHVGGSIKNVRAIFRQSLMHDFDGYMIEMHPEPAKAATDSSQQLSPSDFFSLFDELVQHKKQYETSCACMFNEVVYSGALVSQLQNQ